MKKIILFILTYFLCFTSFSQTAEDYYEKGVIKISLYKTFPKANNNLKIALIDFDKAIELNPKYESAYFDRGNVKNDLKDYFGALRDYDKAIELNSNYTMAYYNRGLLKKSLNDFSNSIKDFDKAIELGFVNENSFFNRGNAKFQLKDFYGAIKDFNKAIEFDPYFADAYYNIGGAEIILGNKKEACTNWATAGELGKSKAYDYIKKYCQ